VRKATLIKDQHSYLGGVTWNCEKTALFQALQVGSEKTAFFEGKDIGVPSQEEMAVLSLERTTYCSFWK
jgi:hypothetical protein